MNRLTTLFQSSTTGPAHYLGGAAQPTSFIILWIAVAFVIVGIFRLVTSPDDLWEAHKRAASARGLLPVRSAAWERNARWSAWACLTFGAVTLLFSVWMSGVAASYALSHRMSGARINGRQLTQEEWDACGKDPLRCTEMYAGKGQ